MYDHEARDALAADPALGLEHLYSHKKGFVLRGLGVEVKDAEDARVNGWYQQREKEEGPPRPWSEYTADWEKDAGRHWYEKDDGYFLYVSNGAFQARDDGFVIFTPDGDDELYQRVMPRGQPYN